MKYASRKYIELLQDASSRRVNWDPLRNISVGDYGMIINETGEFDWEGNIYSLSFQERLKSSKYKFDVDLTDPALHPKEQVVGDDLLIFKSWGVTSTTKAINGSSEAAVQNAENVLEIDVQFDGTKPGAVLVMYKPRNIFLPSDERIVRLLKAMPDILKGKYIVTEVISCAAYMMHLSDQRADKFSMTLKPTTPFSPAAVARGAVDFAWTSECNYGLSRQGSDPTTRYIPMYRLKKPRSKFWEWPFGQR